MTNFCSYAVEAITKLLSTKIVRQNSIAQVILTLDRAELRLKYNEAQVTPERFCAYICLDDNRSRLDLQKVILGRLRRVFIAVYRPYTEAVGAAYSLLTAKP